MGATAGPVASSFGQTRSTLPPGLFWVTTKGRSDWPVLVKYRTWPGTMLLSMRSEASAARIFSGSSEPALEIAVRSARVVS